MGHFLVGKEPISSREFLGSFLTDGGSKLVNIDQGNSE
jgi:hypothetical protein